MDDFAKQLNNLTNLGSSGGGLCASNRYVLSSDLRFWMRCIIVTGCASFFFVCRLQAL